MRSISDILNLVTDGKVPTREEAAAIIEEEVADRVRICHITDKVARKVLLENIGYCSGYLTPDKADQLNDLFNTEHPIWGRTHPTPEQALRLGMEYADRGIKNMERDEDER